MRNSYYYEFDETVDMMPWIVYNPDGVEVIACDDEDEAKGYVELFSKGAK